MQNRRTLLTLGTAGLVVALLPRTAAAAAARMTRMPPCPVPAGDGIYLRNGWLLGAADLRRLGPVDP